MGIPRVGRVATSRRAATPSRYFATGLKLATQRLSDSAIGPHPASDPRTGACTAGAWTAGSLKVTLQLHIFITPRVVRIAPNRAAAPRDSGFGQNESLGDSTIRRFGNS